MSRTIKVGIGAFAVFLVVAWLAYPTCILRVRGAREESDILGYLRTIQQREENYKKQHGRFATELSELDTHAPNRWYKFSYSASSNPDGYSLVATPEARGQDGQRSFFLDQSGRIRFDMSANAETSSHALE